MNRKLSLLDSVADYYTEKLRAHGATSMGVDWNSKEGQELRFLKLSGAILSARGPTRVLDFGSGFGAHYEWFKAQAPTLPLDYTGYDISEEMVEKGRALHPTGAQFTSVLPETPFDFVVASGVFNVRLKASDLEWKEHIERTLDQMNTLSTRGFSFNCLTLYSDPPKRRDYLYYADPLWLFDLCKCKYSRYVSLIHDYPLYEFTIVVTKEEGASHG